MTYVKGKGNIHTYWIASEHVLEKTPKTGFKPTIKQNYIKTKTGIILNTNEETKLGTPYVSTQRKTQVRKLKISNENP